MSVIRSSYSVCGTYLECAEQKDGRFFVQSRWDIFHRTSDIHEALAVFEGLCFEDGPSKAHAKRLANEARRIKRNDSASPAGWEWDVIKSARKRAEGMRPVICGSKGSTVKWVAA
jgi:hypothetical protein